MPFCTQCGTQNPDGSRFCSNCGAPLRVATEATPEQRPGARPERGGVESTSTISLTGIDPSDPSEPSDLSPADQAAVDALPPGSALLVVKRGPNAGSRFLLDADVTNAGRHPESDIFLDDVTVSRRHAEFRRGDDDFVVRDVGSLNGTYVNRQRIDETSLAPGDEVQIGKYRLVFFAGASREVPG
jgi:pSer/pThr/pTyr-binding forkhead associated (FHA) protein